jgi:hypothetical protein
MPFAKTWDETVPNDSTALRDGDDHIRDFKVAQRERLAVEHNFYADETGHSDVGEHKLGSARTSYDVEANKPTTGTFIETGRLFVSSDSRRLFAGTGTEMFEVAAVTKGIICMWSGAVDAVPWGWALCDGTNGTPDLRDRFIVGAGSTYAKGATGGATSVNLAHTHLVWVVAAQFERTTTPFQSRRTRN